jgi:hypothetical protein
MVTDIDIEEMHTDTRNMEGMTSTETNTETNMKKKKMKILENIMI